MEGAILNKGLWCTVCISHTHSNYKELFTYNESRENSPKLNEKENVQSLKYIFDSCKCKTLKVDMVIELLLYYIICIISCKSELKF